MIRAIVAIDSKNGIAKNGVIPWKLVEDLSNFKKITANTTVLMGQKTFDSIGKALPSRQNVIVSRTQKNIDGLICITNPILYLNNFIGDIWVIGGASIYRQTLDLIEELHVTRVEPSYDCDKFFPEFDNKFNLIKTDKKVTENGQKYEFQIWRRNSTEN